MSIANHHVSLIHANELIKKTIENAKKRTNQIFKERRRERERELFAHHIRNLKASCKEKSKITTVEESSAGLESVNETPVKKCRTKEFET